MSADESIPTADRGGGPKILLYSHDSWGLGHLRRNLNLAGGLSAALPRASILLCSGSPCATHFPLPPRTDIVKLPTVSKDAEGRYVPRYLGLGMPQVMHLRERLLSETFRAFAPHLLIVDHQVTGLQDELLNVLQEAREAGTATILGVRDVVDAPSRVRVQWDRAEIRWAFEHAYDRICVYGRPEVFDPRVEYALPSSVRDKIVFTGYVAPQVPRSSELSKRSRRRVLVTVGGGEDGIERLHRYIDAIELDETSWRSTLIAGPLMPGREVKRIKRRVRNLGRVRVRRFHSDLPRLLAKSDAVVCMAGYNISAEAMQSGRPVVFLPRTFPRVEQLVRAQRLERLGLCRYLVEPTARALRCAVEDALAAGPTPPSARLVLDGRRRLCEVAESLLPERGVSCSATDSSQMAAS